MSESRRDLEPWKADDDITALRLQSMQDIAEAAQLHALGKNVRLYKGVQGGTAIAVDDPPPSPPAGACHVTVLDPNPDVQDQVSAAGTFGVTYNAALNRVDGVEGCIVVDWNQGAVGSPPDPLPFYGLTTVGHLTGQIITVDPGDFGGATSVPLVVIPAPSPKQWRINTTTGQLQIAFVIERDNSQVPSAAMDDSYWVDVLPASNRCTED